MRAAAGLIGVLAAVSGVIALLFISGAARIDARYALLGAGSCAVGLVGAGLVLAGRPRVGGLLLLEATIGIYLSLGEYGLIPSALFALTVLLALLSR